MSRLRLIAPALLACAAILPAFGQQPAPAAAPAYDSAFASYQAYKEPEVADWKQTNATIAAVPSGHGAHMSGMDGEADPHAGHNMGGDAKAEADPHAGHNMGGDAKAEADPHAGHDMSAMTAAPVAKPAKPAPKKAGKASKAASKPPADPHAAHQHH